MPRPRRLRPGELKIFLELSAHLRASRETTHNALTFGFGDFFELQLKLGNYTW